MSTTLINFPLSSLVDGVLSYLKWIFGNPEITPSEYRYNDDDRASRIRISAPFAIDNEKPMSAPFIVVERGSFQFANRTIDHLRSGNANDFSDSKFVDWADGSLNIICGSRSAGEASSLANFIAIMMQADRHGIASALENVRNFYMLGVSPEVPVFKDTEVRRWEVTLQAFASIQFGWLKKDINPEPLNKAAIYNTKNPEESFSNTGVITADSDILFDENQDFGPLITNDPQLLQQEFDRGWYYIRFEYEGKNDQLYTIAEIVDNHTLKLTTHDENGVTVPWSAPESMENVEYKLLWNNLHIHVEVPIET